MDLGFEDVVKKEFKFLHLKHGFKCVKSEPWLVTYLSEFIFINIRFDNKRSYELGCEIGRKDNFRGSLDTPFDLGEIIKSKGYAEKDFKTFFQVTDSDCLKKFVKRLADELKIYATDILTGSDESFNAVADFRVKECKKYFLEVELNFIRNQLHIAWHNKNYQKVIDLLVPLKKFLKKSELKKLNYSLKQVKKNNLD